jgi:hypothetical protein
MKSYSIHLFMYNTIEKMEFKNDIILMSLIILKFLYFKFVVVMWQLSWTTCM